MARITRRTGRMDKIGSIPGAIVFGLFSLVGFAIPMPGSSDPFFADMDGFVIAFKVVWIGLCLSVSGYMLYMSIKGEGISKETVDVDSNGDPLIQVRVDAPAAPAAPAEPRLDFEARLRKIEKLRDDGLITQEEFEEKRKQIMGETW